MIHSTYVWDDSSNYLLAEFYNSDGTKSKHYRYTALPQLLYIPLYLIWNYSSRHILRVT